VSEEHGRWCLVVPVKRLAVAKTRLGPPYDTHRRALALAFALDTTAAALASDAVCAVLVVTDEPEAADLLAATGADVVDDEPDAGLNPALSHGASVAALAHPGCGLGALSADLPALRPDELSRALGRAAAHETSFVRDAEGTGSTLVLARSLGAFRPEFGPDSARRHKEAGFAELAGDDIASVRNDVDTTADLGVATRLGVGPRTARLLESLG
jgi:2-phospho-L-lactate/phosphoenolpyruvate guanylyltransferase